MTATVVSTVLNRENYKDWRFRMKTYFSAEELWDVVEGLVNKPLEEEEEHLKAWKKKDAKALYAIQNCCGDDTYPLIKDKTTAEAAWLSLSWRFEPYEPTDEGRYENVGDVYPSRPESALEEGRSVTGGHDERVESVETLECNANHVQETFVKYVESNDWDNAINFLRQRPQAASASMTFGTALHHAIRKRCSVRIMQQLVELMAKEHLEILDIDGHTALNWLIIFYPERVEVAECMVKKNPNLLSISPSGTKRALVVRAQENPKGEQMARYLYSLTPPETIKVVDAAQLISDGFRLQRFDIAWDLIQRYPKLALDTDHDGNIPIGTLARPHFAFKSGRRLGLWEKLIYYGISIKPLPSINKDSHTNVDKGPHAEQKENKRHHLIYSGIDRIYQIKLVHERVQQFLPLMCKVVRKEDMSEYQERKLDEALCVAVQRGHVEYITHLLRYSSYPVTRVRNIKLQSLFHIAAECRRHNVCNLIYELLQKQDKYGLDQSKDSFNQLDGLKEVMEHKDELGNNMLHTVARITPLSQIDYIQGAALQMQRELQWFKEVESIADPKDFESVNKDGKTPRQVFAENHKDLGKEAEKSMKETATSCTVVGALIVTITFAAALTVPGGNDEKMGLPMGFTAFIVSDAISLFFSTTSVFMFLGILTSHYSEDDFHIFLPINMIIGIFTLFLSIFTMILVFLYGFYIILDWKLSIVIPTSLFAGVPAGIFMRMQFPLLVNLSISTFGQRIFYRK